MKNLIIKWTISKGRDTYGYNICTLWDGDKAYRCNGGGYDMLGTVFANWLFANYKESIINACKPATQTDKGYDGFYGFFHRNDNYYLDGACGFSCMELIAKAIGLMPEYVRDRKGNLTNILI